MPAISTLPSEGSAVAAPGSTPGASAGCGLIRLRAAFGADEASHGTVRFSVDNDGLFHVPPEAVFPLVAVGGFSQVEAGGNPCSFGVVRLRHEDATACSYAGRQYRGIASGDVLVPADATTELSAHGFVPVCNDARAPSAEAKGAPKRRPPKG
jgi:hypothetical protein